jgi:flavin reductase (DIM6/NTAB) family NADH-FMN oxidoreductase RutF
VPVERQEFLEIMASFPSGVAVITTVRDDEPRGLTTTAFSSVSAEPPLLLVCVDLTSRTLTAVLERGSFVVNFLRSGRDQLARHFASKVDDKFGAVAWRPSPTGLPLLHDDAVAWAECSLEQEIGAGDHVILLGRVDAGAVLYPSDVPLMYYRRTWGEWTPRHES